MDTEFPRRRTTIGAASMVVSPALMSVGDLLHPAESWNAAAQVAIIAESGSRWYAAHLLLFAGMLLFLPGILTLTEAAASRKPAIGFATRVLMLASAAVLSAVFVFEMLLGRFISDGADDAAAVALIDTFQSTAISGALLPGLLAFFIGAMLTVVSFASSTDPFRWPAYRRPASLSDREPRHLANVSKHPPLSEYDGARKRDDRVSYSRGPEPVRRRPAHAALPEGRKETRAILF